MPKKIFVRIGYDSDNIKDASVWKIILVNEANKILYIETLHENISDKIPEENYVKCLECSYLKGLTNVDSEIASLKFTSAIDGEECSPINIYSNEDKFIREKIVNFLGMTTDDLSVEIYFKNAFEEVLFFNFMQNSLADYSIGTLGIENIMCDPAKNYEKICEQSFTTSCEELAENEEMSSLLKHMKLVIETLILKDLIAYINKPINND